MHEQNLPLHEQAMAPATLDRLAYAGNDERKLLIILALHKYGGALAKQGLHDYLGELSYREIPGARGASLSMVEKSLTKIDAVEPEEVTVEYPNRPHPIVVQGYKLSPLGTELVPFSGSLLGWSMRHRKFSLNQLLGSSVGGGKAPVLRFWMLHDLVNIPEESKGPYMTGLARHVALPRPKRQQHINRLVQWGVVTHEKNFKLQSIDSSGKLASEKLTPASQLLCSAFEAAYAQKEVWSLDEFLNFMDRLHPKAEPDDIYTATIRLSRLFPKATINSWLVEDQGDRVAIAPEAQKAVTDLIDIVKGYIVGDPAVIEQGEAAASKIISTPRIFRSLYIKAFEHSNYTDKDEELGYRLIGIVRSLGAQATVRTILDAYTEETGRKIVRSRIYQELGKLVASGRLKVVQSEPPSRYRKRPAGLYSVVENK